MSEYTPSMDRLKGAWVDQCAGMDPEMRGNEEWIRAQQATFDRAIAAHDAELREQIAQDSQMGPVPYGWNASGIASWLRARAEQIEEGAEG